MRNSKKGIFALIGLLAVGFAAVTATLVINGTSIFGANDDSFVIIFSKAIVDGVNKSAIVISEDGKTINYTTNALVSKGDESILDFTVRNTSTQYDAEVSIECIGGTNEGTYYKIEKSVADYIPAQTEDDGQVIVTMIKSSTEPIEEEFTCTIIANAVERETEADIVPMCSLQDPPTECNEDGGVCWTDLDCSGDKTLGDIVSLGTEENSIEEFYILTSNEEETEMMSKYNLYVGGVSNINWVTPGPKQDPDPIGSWDSYSNSSGIQDSEMLGANYDYVGEMHPYYEGTGMTAYSNISTDYSGSIVEGYVNYYSSYLKNILQVENTATIISKEELESLLGITLVEGNLKNQASNVPAFLYSTSYWTRSPYDDTNVWELSYQGYVGYNYCFESLDGSDYDYNLNGVRPVVTIDNEVFDRVFSSETEISITYKDENTDGEVSIGDIVTINETEEFYIIGADEAYITLLSKFSIKLDTLLQADVPYNEAGTDFSSTAYWNETGDTLTYPYDLVEVGEPSEDHYAAYYAYKYGEKFGVTTGRLMTYNEANTLKDTIPNIIGGYYAANSSDSDYWLAAAAPPDVVLESVYYQVYYISGGSLPIYLGDFTFDSSNSVRPVITISADLIA